MKQVFAAFCAALAVALVSLGSVQANLTPNEIIRIGFTQSEFTVLEGESVDIPIFIETSDGLPLDPAADVTLRISDNVGSGNTAIDLTRLMGDISFNAQNDRVVSFTVPMNQASGSTLSFTGIAIAENDNLDGELRFVLFIDGFSLSQTSGSGIFGFITVIVDDDDDDPMVSLTAGSFSVQEEDGSLGICAVLNNVLAPGGTSMAITVNLIVTSGTATIGAGQDAMLSMPSDGVLIFSAGSMNGEEVCATFTVISDDTLEGDESFQVSLDSPTGGANLDDPMTATATITDNEMATVSLQPVSDTAEGNDALVTVRLSPPNGGTAISITVTLGSTDGDATLGDDFVFDEGMTVTFPPTDALMPTASLNVTIVDDTAIEFDHSFTVNISGISLAAVTAESPSSVTVSIIDNDESEANVTFDDSLSSVSEDAGTTMLCANLSLTDGFTLETTVMASFVTDPFETESSMDFTIESQDMRVKRIVAMSGGFFEFDSEGQICLMVTIEDDDLLEFDEQFNVDFSDVSPPGIQIQPLSSTGIVINDDEERDALLVFEQSSLTVDEPDDAVEVCVVVSGITGTVETPFEVNVTLTNNTAIIDDDYEGPSMISAVFSSGSGLTSCIEVGIIDDDPYEGPETFTADIVASTISMLAIGEPNTTTVEIFDREDAVVSFADVSASQSENSSPLTVLITLDADEVLTNIYVPISAQSGTATMGTDFMSSVSPVMIPAGTMVRMFSHTVTFDDEDIVESDETFTLSLPAQDTVPYAIGENATLSATIENDDLATVQLELASVSADETEGILEVNVEVTLTEGSEIDLQIPVFTQSDSMFNPATSDVDYDSSIDPVTLAANMSNGTFTLPANITLIDDMILEFAEEFTVFLDMSDPPFGVMFSGQLTTTVNLGDDESDNNVNMVENGTVVLESDGIVMVCARIEGVSEIERGFDGNFQFIRDEDLTVAGEDFTFSGMLVFQFNGGPSNTACINIGISDDFDFEGDHSFIVSLSEMASPPIGPPMPVKRTVFFSSPSGPLIGPNSQTMVTIDDSEDAVIEFLNATLYTEELGMLDIYLLVESDGTFQVNLTVELEYISSDLAVLGEDFEIIDSYVEIPENFTSGIVELSVAIIPDLFVEGDHSFIVRIVDDGAFTVGTNSAVEVIILDDDICDVDIEIVMDPDSPPYLIEGVTMTTTVCILIDDIPGRFQTSITIPLIIKEFVPKRKHDPYYGYGKGSYHGNGKGGGGGFFLGNGFVRKRRDDEEQRSRYARSPFMPSDAKKFGKFGGNPAIEDEDFSLEMDFGNFVFDNETMVDDVQCANITILDDEIFEKFQVILLTIGESDPPGIERDEFLKIKIIDDEIADTLITVLNTSLVEMEEAKSTFDICAELNVTEVQTKVDARFAVLLDRSLLDNASPGNFTCRNDSSIELPLAYLCEGVPPFYDDGGYRRKRHVGDYGHYFIDCPDRSDESPDTCGDRRNFEFRPGNDIAKFNEYPVACATLDIYEDLDYEGDMAFSVLLVDVFPYDIFLRGNIRTDFLIHDTGDATVFLQDAELDVLEGTNVSVCGEIELAGELLTDITIEFVTLSGGPGADDEDINQLESMAVFSASDNVQTGDVACVTLSVVEDDILEPMVEFLVLFDIDPLVNEPPDAPDFTRVRVIDTTAQDVILDFATTSLSGAEGELVEVCVVITDFPVGGVEIPVTLELETRDGTKAVLGTDYDFTAGSSVTFEPGDFTIWPAPQPMCLNISLLTDDTIEGDHSFQLFISSELAEPEITPGANSNLTITIYDQNTATVGYDNDDLLFLGREDEDEVEVCLRIFNIPNGGLECNVTVSLSAFDGAKTVAGNDFVPPMMLNIVFPVFETEEGDTECASISIIDDMELEGDRQDFTIHIGDIDPPNVMNDGMVYATIRIQDDDEDDATIGFVKSVVNITEGELLEVCLELNDVPPGGVSCGITVTLAAQPSLYGKQAMEDSDFTVLDNEINFEIGSGNGTRSCANFTAISSDMALEGFHHFLVTVNETNPPINIDDNAQYLSVYVQDNDTALAEPVINFHFTISEETFNRYVNVCVEINSLPENGLECDTVIYLVAQSGTAIEGEDFEEFSIPVYFESSNDSSPLTSCTRYQIPVIDDNIFEDTQFLSLFLRSSIPQIEVDNSVPITVYIEDNDIVTVDFGLKEYIVEEGGSISVCLEFEECVQTPFEVNITRQRLTDLVDGDSDRYVLATYVLAGEATFDNTLSEEETCNTINVNDDIYKEGLETFVLWLEANNFYIFFGRDQALFLVPSNDVVYVSAVDTEFIVGEDEGALHLCLQVSHTVRTRAVIDISTSSESATAYEDFIPLDTSLVFDEGLDSTQCVYIPILNDECLEYDEEYFNITLTSEQDCVHFINDSFEAVIIDNDCVVISFEEAEYTVYESVGVTEVCIELCSGDPKRDFEFYVDAINSSATSPADFYIVSSTMLLYNVSEAPARLCIEINITDDTYLEANEYFYLQLNSTDPDVKFKIDHSIIKIVDDDTAFLSLSRESYQVSESDGILHTCVTLFNSTERNVMATLYALPGTASEDDYSGLPVVLTFTEAGQQCFYITITQDNLLEGTENFYLILATRDDDIIFDIRSTVVYIVDDNMLTIGFGQAGYSMAEDDGMGAGSSLEICLNISGGTVDRTVVISVADEDGTAIGGVDYDQFESVIMTISLTFDEGGAKRRKRSVSVPSCFSVTFLPDDLVEFDETFDLQLSTDDPDIALFPNTTTITITNNDYANVSLQFAEYGGLEGSDLNVTVCSELIAGVLERGITVDISTSDITAMADSDYVALTNDPFYYVAGSPLNSERCVDITILDDDVIEADQSFDVSLSTSDPVFLTPIEQATVIIATDNDTANVTLEEAVYMVNESDVYVMVCAVLTEGELERDITIYVSTSDDTALSPGDYTALANFPLTFYSGDPVGTSRCTNVTIIDDDIIEPDQSFSVSLSSTDPVYITPTSQAQIVIIDNDFATVSLSDTLYESSEENETVSVCAVLEDGELERVITVYLSTGDATAIAPGDYVPVVNAPLTFSIGASLNSLSCANISIFNDLIVEYVEEFTVSLSSIDPVIIDPTQEANVSITDNDFATASLEQASYSVNEGDGFVMVCVELTDGVLERMITVYLSTSDGTTMGGVDYVSVMMARVEFMSGDALGTTACQNVTIIDDDPVETNETFTVSASSSDPVNISPVSQSEVTIFDNDVVVIAFTLPTYQTSEMSSPLSVCTVLVSGELERSVTVALTTSNQVAVAPNDYMALNSEPVAYMSGDMAGIAMQCVNVTIVDEDIVEPDETFNVLLSSDDPGVQISAMSDQAMATITNDDRLSVSWQQEEYMFSESNDPQMVCAEIVAGSLEIGVSVAVQAENGTALAGLDFNDEIADISFMSGQGVGDTSCTSINIIVDSDPEDEESFTIVLQENLLVEVVQPNVSTVFIAEAEIGFAQIMYTVLEGQNLTVCLQLSGGLQEAVDVDVTATPGTAQGNGMDYTFPDVVVTFDGSQSELFVTLMTTDDSVYEFDETLELQLSTSSMSVVSLTPSMATVTITDNDIVNLVIVNSTAMLTEGDGPAVVCVSIDAEIERSITVSISAMSVTATVNEDFMEVADVMFTADGPSVICADISIVDDQVAENCVEMFGVTITSDGERVIDPSDMVVVQIIDDDEPEFCFISDTPMVDGPNLTVIFELRGCADVLCQTTTTELIDCTPEVGSLMGEYSVFNLPQRNADISGHILTVTVSPTISLNPPQVFTRAFRTDNSDRCAAVFINKGVTVDLEQDTVTVEFAGTGPGMLPQDTVNEFSCIFNGNNDPGPRDCSSPFVIPLDDPDLVFGVNEIGVRPRNAEAICDQQRINRFNFDIIVDPVTVSFEMPQYNADEGSGVQTVCVELTGGTVERRVVLSIASADSNAMAPADYIAVAEDLNFTASDVIGSTRCVDVMIIDDDVLEGDHSFTISLSSADPVVFGNAQATVVILDNDAVNASLELDTYDFPEDATDEAVCILLSSSAERAVTVLLSTDDQTAMAPDDYSSLVNEAVMLPPGSTRMCVDLTIIDDDEVEETETFLISLDSSDVNVIVIPPSQAIVNILDNDLPILSISQFDTSVSEGDGMAEVCVSIDRPIVSDVTFTITPTDESALGGEDFMAGGISGMFTQGGDTQICFQVSILDDSVAENCVESFAVTLSSGDAAIGSPSQEQIQISDDDEPEFCFINDTPHVEGNVLELELQLLGCASLTCADDVEPFSADCTPTLGSTTRVISFPGLTQVNSGGHRLVVTVTPDDSLFPVQTQERGFRVDNPDRCTAVFINKGITVSVADGMVTVEWEGTGPGVEPEDTVDLFTCEINSNAPRSCASPYTIDFSDPELVLPGVNEIAVRVDPSLDPICPRRPRQRMNFELPDIPQ